MIMELRSGDILICKGTSLISRLIMRFSGDWSHSAIYAESWGAPGVIEAQRRGIHFKLWSYWVDRYAYDFVVFRYNKPFNERDIMLKSFSKCASTKYDFFNLIIRMPIKLITGKSYRSKNENKKMVCSEFVGWVWNMEMYHQMTPTEQYQYLMDSEDFDLIEL